MGVCSSSPESPEAKAAREQSAAIEKQMEEAQKMEEEKIKILLLGAGESGKSTIFKQFQILYGAPRSNKDLKMFAAAVRNNITVLLKRLIPLVGSLKLEEKFEPNERAAYNKILETISGQKSSPAEQAVADAAIPVNLKEEIQTLFQSKTWESVWADRSTVNAHDGHKLFIDELDVIAAPDYVPTAQHIVNARIRTTYAVKEEYDIGGKRFEIYDVGGQRSERKKWMPLFDKVTAIIFVAALSEYDQKLQEDPRMNRMMEAIGLFKTVITQESFLKTPILLFLNKKDLFEDKLSSSKIQDQIEFKDYSGDSYEEGTQYFEQKFVDCFDTPREDWEERIFVHSTEATDTQNVEFVWDACKNIIMEQMFSDFL